MAHRLLVPFWNSIKTGEYNRVSWQVICDVVDDVYFGDSPLVAMGSEETELLREQVSRVLKKSLRGSRLEELAATDSSYLVGDHNKIKRLIKGRRGIPDRRKPSIVYYEVPTKTGGPVKVRTSRIEGDIKSFGLDNKSIEQGYPYLFVWDTSTDLYDKTNHVTNWKTGVREIVEGLGGRRLSPSEKMSLLSDINVWRDLHVVTLSSSSTGHKWGYRPIKETFFIDEEEFYHAMQQIREQTGREQIRLLDVGGGLGEACYEAEQLDPNIQATNLTVLPEPAMYGVKTVYCSAERMPESFKGQFDLVWSANTFRYLVFPDLAIDNCIAALDVGGEARISLDSLHQHPVRITDLEERMARKYQELTELRDQGLIELDYSLRGPDEEFRSGRLKIKKLKEF
jgi:hypothetical protein